jgi:tRNA nucleotidyltransferase (CCA-adding enzyme)
MLDPAKGDALRARRLLARHGDELALDLVDHRLADLRAKHGPGGERPAEEVERLEDFRRVVERERSNPHRVRDLAVDGNDLIELGFRPGPDLGHALQKLLQEVVRDPSLNTRDELTQRARALLV